MFLISTTLSWAYWWVKTRDGSIDFRNVHLLNALASLTCFPLQTHILSLSETSTAITHYVNMNPDTQQEPIFRKFSCNSLSEM
jgi:hypothetical protein